MKTKTFFFVLLTAIIFSCQKDLCLTDSSNERLASTLLTKSLIPPHETPYFDWEDTSYIHICNYGDVLLPWVVGAESNIAPEILHDYHRAHGWEMLYNLCSDSVLNVYGKKNYLIFYNKIRGILRIYYYNTNTSSTGAKDTFAHISTLSPSRIWDFGQGTIAKSPISSESGTYAPNRVINPYTSSLTMGWNCFETELAYDAISGPHQDITITLLDQIHYDLQFKGILTGSAVGRVLSPVTSSSGNISLQQYASAAKSTLGEISTIIEKASKTKIEAAAVIAIVSAGIGIIQNLWGLFARTESSWGVSCNG